MLLLPLAGSCARVQQNLDDESRQQACQLACRMGEGRRAGRATSCEKSCARLAENLPKACETRVKDWVGCIAKSDDRPAETITKAWLDSGRLDMTRCRREAESMLECRKTCLQRKGTLVSGTLAGKGGQMGTVFEAIHAGCGSCRSLKGYPPGATCTASRVCEAVCCACPDGLAFEQVRACISGQCASAGEICRLLLGDRDRGACFMSSR